MKDPLMGGKQNTDNKKLGFPLLRAVSPMLTMKALEDEGHGTDGPAQPAAGSPSPSEV